MNKPSYPLRMSEQSDHSLINFIATTVETMREQMATKDDIVRLESRMEAMRESLESRMDTMDARMDSLEAKMVTKDELGNEVATLRKEMATKDDLARLATTVRGDFEQVHLRFDTIARVLALTARETDSVFGSVVYLSSRQPTCCDSSANHAGQGGPQTQPKPFRARAYILPSLNHPLTPIG